MFLFKEFNFIVLLKKNYESYIIFDGNLEDNAIEELISKYDNLYVKNDAEIKNIDRIGRRRLAYPIKKRLNGYYVCFEFLAGTDFVTKLEKAYKLDENILRYLSVFMTKKTLLEREDYFRKKIAFAEKLEEERKETPKEETAAVPKAESNTEQEITN